MTATLANPILTDPLRPPPERLQDYLPERLRERAYYQPGAQGGEASIQAWLERRRKQERNKQEREQ